jgi:hypothetical protein
LATGRIVKGHSGSSSPDRDLEATQIGVIYGVLGDGEHACGGIVDQCSCRLRGHDPTMLSAATNSGCNVHGESSAAVAGDSADHVVRLGAKLKKGQSLAVRNRCGNSSFHASDVRNRQGLRPCADSKRGGTISDDSARTLSGHGDSLSRYRYARSPRASASGNYHGVSAEGRIDGRLHIRGIAGGRYIGGGSHGSTEKRTQ